jgi:hypothetical protein
MESYLGLRRCRKLWISGMFIEAKITLLKGIRDPQLAVVYISHGR